MRPRRWIFITHPDVVIDPAVPVPRWPLSERGLERMRAGLRQPWVREVTTAKPDVSVRGWERALDAQRRIVAAVQAIDRSDTTPGTVAIVSHGAVGALLHCWLAIQPISRQWDQPANGGGNGFAFTLKPRALLWRWQAIDHHGPTTP